MISFVVCACFCVVDDVSHSPDKHAAELSARTVIEGIESHAEATSNGLFVVYDLYVTQEGKSRSHKLTVTESLDQAHHFMDVVHWYHGDVYEFYGHAELDPIRNWYLWTPEAKRQLWTTLGAGVIGKAEVAFIPAPSVQHFSGYLGILSPDRTCISTDMQNEDSIDIRAEDYFFPYALRQEGWRMESREGAVALIRETENFRDEIVVDPQLGFALLDRRILLGNGGTMMRIRYHDHEEVSESLFLPTRIVVSSEEPYDMELDVTRLEVGDVRASIPDCEFPPGTIIHDRIAGSQRTVPGGLELLDLTVRRMQLALDSHDKRSSRAYALLLIPVTALILSLLLVFRLKLRPKVARDDGTSN